MTTFVNYITAFWTVVVMNCIQPVNWEYCLPVHEWLLPDIIDGVEVLLNPDSIYEDERERLESINKQRT
jgi:hypothetical protein|tara:strand:- start:762 stop:968 length:207 start_codon:yes stop_codon:yes gene_type:complete